MLLQSYAAGEWIAGRGSAVTLAHAITGRPVAEITSSGVDFAAMADYARTVGGPALRALTFHQRAVMLKQIALLLLQHKEAFYRLSRATGATRSDSWIDIEGGIATLFSYSGKGRREMPNARVCPDGPAEPLAQDGSFAGQHLFTPLQGVAVHINAFNFPCWGMLEKLGPTLIAGMPAIVKPASQTAYLAELMFRRIIESGILPPGALQLICGGVGDLFDHLGCQDVVSFTGSADTAIGLRQHPVILSQSVRFTQESDSLNASVLGTDARPGRPEFELFVDEVVREMTVKCGQKCTAIRRLLVPRLLVPPVLDALRSKLAQIQVGDPEQDGVTMGALAGIQQRDEVVNRVKQLALGAEIVHGALDGFGVAGADPEIGAFLPPLLLHCDQPLANPDLHVVEAFGPVSTVMPYDDEEQAVALARLGQGSLVCSVFSNDDRFAESMVLGLGAWHGRILLVNRHCAGSSTGHGSPLPNLVHGGPGRAGGGEEMGGIRGVFHYMQRTALQGSPTTLSRIAGRWIAGADRTRDRQHPFRKYLEQLRLGESVSAGPRLVTLDEIEHFAAFTGDRFYAHTDAQAARANPFFDGRVAHGYLIVSLAAGLFVDPAPGPVLANYGLENLRFHQPVYPGDAVYVTLTCKQITPRENERYGEVRWDCRVDNQHHRLVARYDVLTLVAKRAVKD